MTSRDHPLPGGSQQPLGVWLTLIALVACAIVVVRIDSRRDDGLRMQLKSARPGVAAPSRTTPAVNAVKQVSPSIRVNITPGGTSTLTLEVRGPYEIRQVSSARALSREKSLASVKVQATPTGLKVGDSSFSTTQLEIVPRQGPVIRVDEHLYRGSMRLFRAKDGRISAVNVLPLEEYLASVVDSEMPAAFPEAARQAQAIVSRTYALYQMSQANPAAVYDLFSTQKSQKYLGFEYTTAAGRRLAGESAASRKAVAETSGIVCTYRGQMFCTYYSAVCGGRTTTGTEIFADAAPVLKSVACDWCRESVYYRWTAQLDRREFLKSVQGLGKLPSLSSVRQTAGPGGGAISRFFLLNGKQSLEVTGIELRDRFPAGTIRSPHFVLKLEKDQVRVEGRGHGHGAGFCQWGARGQGLSGKSAHDIVRHYYPGAELAEIDYRDDRRTIRLLHD